MGGTQVKMNLPIPNSSLRPRWRYRGKHCILQPSRAPLESQKQRSTQGISERPLSATYLVAVTDFTEMVAPSAVPVTLACSQANLLSVSSVA